MSGSAMREKQNRPVDPVRWVERLQTQEVASVRDAIWAAELTERKRRVRQWRGLVGGAPKDRGRLPGKRAR